MIRDKSKGEKTGKQHINGQPDCDCQIPGGQDTPQGADNVSDESFEDGDKTADVSVEQDWKDKYMRLSAEFDNYRKRTLREKMDLIAAGGEDVIKPLLGVMDDFDRAVAAMATAADVDSVRQGVVLIRQKLADALRGKGVTEIEAVGQPLDTDLHEAVAQFPAPDEAMKGRIMDVVQKGYRLKDKVIRHAKVVVGE